MATNYKDFSAAKGVVAQGGDIKVKAGYSLVAENTSGNSVAVKAPATGLSSSYTLTLPTTQGDNGSLLSVGANGALTWLDSATVGAGSVTSVALSAPTGLTVTGSPVTSAGTLALALDTGYVIPTQTSLDAKLEAADIADKLEADDISYVQNPASGNGALTYAAGVITYTPPDLSGFLTSVSQSAVTQHQAALSITESQISDLQSYLTSVSESDVTQHQAALSITESQISDLQSYLTSETLTSLSVSGNTLTYTDENGAGTDIDLSLYLDDTNLARLTSGSIDGNGLATFTRDDATTFTVDFSSLFDDTNLARITGGSVSGTELTLTRDDATSVSIDVSSLLDNVDTNDFVTSASFNSETGVVTLTRDGGGTVAVDLDGRYVERNGAAAIGSATIGTNVDLKSANLSAGTSLVQTLYATDARVGAKVTITCKSGINDSTQITEVLVTNDPDNNVYLTEFGTVYTSAELISSITGDVNTGNVSLTVNTSVDCEITMYIQAL